MNNILQKIYERFFVTHLSIKDNLERLLFIVSAVSLIIVGSIALTGLIFARYTSSKTGEEMGHEAALVVNEKLRQEAEERIITLASERARQIELQLIRIEDRVETIAAEASNIVSHDENYRMRVVEPPKREKGGIMSVQLEFAEWANRAALQHEIGITANIQDLMLYMGTLCGNGAIISVASKNGFTISVDADAHQRFENVADTPTPFDATTRPWYKKGAASKKIIFTDPYKNKFGGDFRLGCAKSYYKNGEFQGVVVISPALTDISNLVLSEKETCFVIDRNGQILFNQDAAGILTGITELNEARLNGTNLMEISRKPPDFTRALQKMMIGEQGVEQIVFEDKSYYISYAPIPKTGWSFAAVLDATAIQKAEESARQEVLTIAENNTNNLETFIYRLILIMIVCVAALIYAFRKIGRKVGNRFARPILALSDDVKEIASGNLNKKINIHTGDEIEHLATCFNIMTEELSKYMKNLTKATAEKERIATELNVATNIQTSMLPSDFPERDEFSIYATMRAAKQVGGDFYDFYMVDEDHLMITIADVSGKGIPAALFMVVTKTILKNFALSASDKYDIAKVVESANTQLSENNDAMMFATAFIGMLNIKNGRFIYVNAGHNPPLVYRAAEYKFSYLKAERNFVLAGMEDLEFKSEEITLLPNDEIFLYTDGVTEALNEEKELYGEVRLLNALNNIDVMNTSIKKQIETVRKSLDSHVLAAEQSDDITMMLLSYTGKVNYSKRH